MWCMGRHTIDTAVALYDSGTLDLEQAARLAGVTPGRFRVTLGQQGVEPAASTATRTAVASE